MSTQEITIEGEAKLNLIDFVFRTEAKGVPRRIAIQRAVKKFSLPANLIRDVLRSQ